MNTQLIYDAESKIPDVCDNLSGDTFQGHLDSNEFQNLYSVYLDFKSELYQNGGDFAEFWLTYLDMTEHLFNMIYATRAGRWHLYLESIRSMFPPLTI